MLLKKDDYSPEESFRALQKIADFSIAPCDASVLSDKVKYSKIKMNSTQKMQLNNLIQHIPQAMAVDTIARSYVVHFPKGMPHTLVALNKGGFASMIRGEDGRFIAHASFYPMTAQAAALGAFNAMSAVTGQYFLAQINRNLTIVNDKLDDILNFLYGDKKAELMAEIDFVQYAYANYGSISLYESQRYATIANLQAARKTAIQDVEFYLGDMNNFIGKNPKDYADLCKLTESALKARECVEMARQLYVMSGILELYYSQNYDETYISFIKKDMIRYINKCDKQITALLGKLIGKHNAHKPGAFEKFDSKERDRFLDRLNQLLEPYQDANDSPIRIALNEALNEIGKDTTYYFDNSGEVYVENK